MHCKWITQIIKFGKFKGGYVIGLNFIIFFSFLLPFFIKIVMLKRNFGFKGLIGYVLVALKGHNKFLFSLQVGLEQILMT
jgi:hypothetical protein